MLSEVRKVRGNLSNSNQDNNVVISLFTHEGKITETIFSSFDLHQRKG